MKRSILYILIIAGLLPTYLRGQTYNEQNNCYDDSIKNKEAVFRKIQINATFKGGPKPFQSFLLKHINHNNLVKELTNGNSIFADTATIIFIVSKYRKMSNLQIRNSKNPLFQKEIEHVIKKSSCFWEPGNYSGKYVDGWYQYDIFYFAELKGSELNIRISFKPYDFVEMQ